MSGPSNLSGTSNNLFGFVERAHKAKTEAAKSRLLNAAKAHAAQAKLVGWPALAQSWEQDVEVIEALLAGEQAGRAA
jgi:hypothetical protein